MRIAVPEIFQDPGGVVVDLRGSVPSQMEDVGFVGPMRGRAWVRAEGTRIRLSGEASADVRQTCARCLREFVGTISVQVNELFDPALQPAWGGELEEGDFIFPLDGDLEVEEIFWQHLLLALPQAPLCRPDCAGLCPVCGADRNVDPCDCVPVARDPRLAVLERFRVE
ncbi:MAG: DUF177 domain-containing protein [Armatimonadota bacterium]|nr:DUF177 domain-containing protein [Armatimonadota bacterium]MDR7570483.1 DUF177 domain-containing protein [Armatimonadota bacterium]MDR7614325.1 DUF177 domain-containing protein [Armatimonadota bacterium]